MTNQITDPFNENVKCDRCTAEGYDTEIFTSENLSRCLRCRKSTQLEVSASLYYTNKMRGDKYETENMGK